MVGFCYIDSMYTNFQGDSFQHHRALERVNFQSMSEIVTLLGASVVCKDQLCGAVPFYYGLLMQFSNHKYVCKLVPLYMGIIWTILLEAPFQIPLISECLELGLGRLID